jgi:hypothetical protein
MCLGMIKTNYTVFATGFLKIVNEYGTLKVLQSQAVSPLKPQEGRHGCNRMVFRFTTNYAIRAYHH